MENAKSAIGQHAFQLLLEVSLSVLVEFTFKPSKGTASQGYLAHGLEVSDEFLRSVRLSAHVCGTPCYGAPSLENCNKRDTHFDVLILMELQGIRVP